MCPLDCDDIHSLPRPPLSFLSALLLVFLPSLPPISSILLLPPPCPRRCPPRSCVVPLPCKDWRKIAQRSGHILFITHEVCAVAAIRHACNNDDQTLSTSTLSCNNNARARECQGPFPSQIGVVTRFEAQSSHHHIFPQLFLVGRCGAKLFGVHVVTRVGLA